MADRVHLEWSPASSARSQILEAENKRLKDELLNKSSALQKSMYEKEIRKKEVELIEYKKRWEELNKLQNNKEDKFYKTKYEEEKEIVFTLSRTVEQLEVERDELLKRKYQVEELTAENADIRNEILSLENRQEYQAENYVKEVSKVHAQREQDIKQLHEKYSEMKTKYERALADLVGQMKVLQASVKKARAEKETLEKQANVEAAKVKSIREKLDETYTHSEAKDQEAKKLQSQLVKAMEELDSKKQLQMQHQNLQQRYDKLSAETEKLRENKIDNDYIISNKDRVIKALEKQIEDAESDSANVSMEKIEQLMKEKKEDEVAIEENAKKIEELNEQLKVSKEVIERATADTRNMADSKEQTINELEVRLKKLTEELDKANHGIAEKVTQLEAKEDEIKQFKLMLKNATEASKRMEDERVSELENLKEMLEITKAALEKTETELKNDKLKKQSKLEELEKEVNKLGQELKELRAGKENVNNSSFAQNLEEANEKLAKENEDLQKQLNKKLVKFDQLRDENEKLNENLDEALTDKVEAVHTVKKKEKEIQKLREMLREAHDALDTQDASIGNGEQYEKLQGYVEELQKENRKFAESELGQKQIIEQLQETMIVAQKKIRQKQEYENQLKKLLLEQEDQIQELQELLDSEKDINAESAESEQTETVRNIAVIAEEEVSKDHSIPAENEVDEIKDKNHFHIPIVVINDSGIAHMSPSSSEDESLKLAESLQEDDDDKLVSELISKYSEALDAEKDEVKNNQGSTQIKAVSDETVREEGIKNNAAKTAEGVVESVQKSVKKPKRKHRKSKSSEKGVSDADVIGGSLKNGEETTVHETVVLTETTSNVNGHDVTEKTMKKRVRKVKQNGTNDIKH